MIIPNRKNRIRKIKRTIENYKMDKTINKNLINKLNQELLELENCKSYFEINKNAGKKLISGS